MVKMRKRQRSSCQWIPPMSYSPPDFWISRTFLLQTGIPMAGEGVSAQRGAAGSALAGSRGAGSALGGQFRAHLSPGAQGMVATSPARAPPHDDHGQWRTSSQAPWSCSPRSKPECLQGDVPQLKHFLHIRALTYKTLRRGTWRSWSRSRCFSRSSWCSRACSRDCRSSPRAGCPRRTSRSNREPRR